MSIEFTQNGLSINGETVPIYSGAIHYWRLDRKIWGGILDNVVAMGFRMVETYIPWSVHELERGAFDFGEINECKDLDAFLSLCEERDLRVLVRPGPHINAELTYYGYPERILFDPEIQAKNAWGTKVIWPHSPAPFPIPSYASKKLYEEVGVFFDAVAPILRKHLCPGGCIVAIQLDNEMSYFFHYKPYQTDYSDHSIALYRAMLSDKYCDIKSLNEIWGSEYKSFQEIEPPKGFNGKDKSDLPYYFDWVEYKEYQIVYALNRLADLWRERGFDIPFFHNLPGANYTPFDQVRLERETTVPVVGYDVYYNTDDIRERVRYYAGTSFLPFSPEFGCGLVYDAVMSALPDDVELCTMYAFMLGMKAVNFYMLAERDRWRGCPITRDNKIRAEYFDFFKRLNEFLWNERLWEFERKPNVLVMRNFDMVRFESLYSTLQPNLTYCNTFLKGVLLPAALFRPTTDMGFKHMIGDQSGGDLDTYVGYEREPWISTVENALSAGGVDFNVSDTHLPLDDMLQYRVIFASMYDFLPEEDQKKLLTFAQNGGTLVIGPGVPYLDRNMLDCGILESYISRTEPSKEKPILLIEKPGETDLSRLCAKPEFKAAGIELAVHKRGDRTLLFAVNLEEQTVTPNIRFEGQKEFVPKWPVAGDSKKAKGSIELTMQGKNVTVWEVRDCD